MIVEWLVNFVAGLLTGLISFLPVVDMSVPDLAGAFSIMKALNAVFPVTECLAVIGLMLAVTGAMFVFKLLSWLWTHVPWIGGAA